MNIATEYPYGARVWIVRPRALGDKKEFNLVPGQVCGRTKGGVNGLYSVMTQDNIYTGYRHDQLFPRKAACVALKEVDGSTDADADENLLTKEQEKFVIVTE